MSMDGHAPRPARPVGSRVLQAELTALWIRGRRSIFTYLGFLYGLLLVLAVSVRAQVAAEPGTVTDTFSFTGHAMMMVPLLLGVLWPLWSWRGEAPSQRGYFFSAPVQRTVHTVARAGAGWLYMLACVGAYVLGVGLFVLGTAGMDALVRPPHLGWFAVFLSATVAYALVTPAAILAERPGSWVVGAVLAAMLAPVLLSVLGATTLLDAYATAGAHLATALVGGGEAASAASYVAAALVWLTLGLAATVAAAMWYRETS
jgi:hypothetical protein